MRAPILFASAAVLLTALAAPRPSSACAVFPSKAGGPPDLSVERVLIVFDPEGRKEHFVREVRFDRVSTRFAFIVPTPARPEVEKVDRSPFDTLASQYPFSPPPEVPSNAKSAPPEQRAGVSVLDVKRVGSFTAFVLAATDAAALEQWLGDNEITRPSNAEPWLAHFIKLSFYFTAFRYDPQSEGDPGITTESVRLSFETKEAYYPYFEPLRDGTAPARTLAVWTIAPAYMVPGALFAPKQGGTQWAVPWQEGSTYFVPRQTLGSELPGVASLLPLRGSLRIQTFEDRRASRNGVSDVLLAQEGTEVASGDFKERAEALIGSLTDVGHTGEDMFPLGDARLTVFEAHPIARGCACRVGAGAGDSESGTPASLLAATVALGALFRRRSAGRTAAA